MTDRSHLVRTPTTDKNGKQTTVYRAPEATAAASTKLPVPSVAAAPQPPKWEPDEAYKNGLEDIRMANEAWRQGDHDDDNGVEYDAAATLTYLMNDLIDAADEDKAAAKDLTSALQDAVKSDGHAAIVMAYEVAPVVEFLGASPAVPEEVRILDNALLSDTYRPQHIHAALKVARTLQYLDLRNYTERYASIHNPRLMAHLWAHTHGVLDYGEDDETIGDHVRLIDERPERVAELAPLIRSGVHAEGIRAALNGGTITPLAAGAL